MDLLGVLEGILFIVGDDGITIDKLSNILEIDNEKVKELLTKLNNEYNSSNRGIKISYLGERFKLVTKKEYSSYFKKLKEERESILSTSQLEVLAIIAYNEPISRVEVDNIRGISSSYIIKKLLSKDLIKVCGKSELPGKPNLYKTTNEFLDYFGLSSINDLPSIEINLKNDEEVELFK